MYLTSTFLLLPKKLLLGPAKNLFFILVSIKCYFKFLKSLQYHTSCDSHNYGTGSVEKGMPFQKW